MAISDPNDFLGMNRAGLAAAWTTRQPSTNSRYRDRWAMQHWGSHSPTGCKRPPKAMTWVPRCSSACSRVSTPFDNLQIDFGQLDLTVRRL